MPRRSIVLCAALLCAALASGTLPAHAQSDSDQCSRESYTPSQRAGCRIWFYATAGNDRFHTYVFQQRLGVLIDWHRVLDAKKREQRFATWGLINDPDCCRPGAPGCPARSLDETYGFDWCPGDAELLRYVGQEKIDGKPYRDPACDLAEGPSDASAGHPHPAVEQRQSACDLRFGTSTGVMGLRKFPNPRFKREQWVRVNGSTASWQGYNRPLSSDSASMDSRVSRLLDGSIEPPFRIGMSCGACHIAFDPGKPPANPAAPKGENLIGAIGNQYLRISEVLASGMPQNSLEWQIFANARPGAVDTSAVPNDQVQNPGTINALFNLDRRPVHDAAVVRWRGASQCPSGADARQCWCEPGRAGKCWQRGQKDEKVHHILKGGEDSIGAYEAIQRVYVNIGSCSEACWTNHITDLRQVDPARRNFGQTPFDIGQCRRDCPEFRAIEDRLVDVKNYLFAQRPTDLWQARGLTSRAELVSQLEKEFGAGAVERGRQEFAKSCARCHSSRDAASFDGVDFHETAPDDPTLRVDWLGNDELTPAAEVGTYSGRAFHSNHMQGHVWQEYGSETLRQKKADPTLPGPSDGGRGYYRNISLLNVWAHAPFMHNNALGPELCGKPADARDEFYTSPYVDAAGKPLPNPPACWKYDPSVEGRYKLYKASMEELLSPQQRVTKVTALDSDVVLDVGPRMTLRRDADAATTGMSLRLPKTLPGGELLPAGRLGNLRHKELVDDLVLAAARPEEIEKKLGKEIASELQLVLREMLADPGGVVSTLASHPNLMRRYSNDTEVIENAGHRFGEGLSDQAKKDLTAFLATL
jgi:hypothetical protein